MKLPATLLSSIGTALVAASCNGPAATSRPQAALNGKDSLKHDPQINDSASREDTAQPPISRDYCPPCGKG